MTGIRLLSPGPESVAVAIDRESLAELTEWVWIDIDGTADREQVLALGHELEFDQLGVIDAIDEDRDLPKLDDFDDHLLAVLHGLRDDRIDTYQVTCFLTERYLVTIHHERSPAVDALWEVAQRHQDIATGPDVLLARLADVLTRRLLSVVEVLDTHVDELITDALEAEPTLMADLTAIRTDLARVRRVVNPQREALDQINQSPSPLLSALGRRRFADVFDLAQRTSQGFDSARSALAEVLDAYRGAEARKATEVTKVLTVYAAIMLPLSLIAGIFGMNFANLPAADSDRGWMIAAAAMVVVTLVSLGFFAALGWIRLPSTRSATSRVGRGLAEAAKAPVKLVTTVIESGKRPVRRPRSRTNRDV